MGLGGDERVGDIDVDVINGTTFLLSPFFKTHRQFAGNELKWLEVCISLFIYKKRYLAKLKCVKMCLYVQRIWIAIC